MQILLAIKSTHAAGRKEFKDPQHGVHKSQVNQ